MSSSKTSYREKGVGVTLTTCLRQRSRHSMMAYASCCFPSRLLVEYLHVSTLLTDCPCCAIAFLFINLYKLTKKKKNGALIRHWVPPNITSLTKIFLLSSLLPVTLSLCRHKSLAIERQRCEGGGVKENKKRITQSFCFLSWLYTFWNVSHLKRIFYTPVTVRGWYWCHIHLVMGLRFFLYTTTKLSQRLRERKAGN